MAAWHALRGAIEGEVVLPESDGYDLLRTPPMARFRDVRPAAIVRCRTAADVAQALAFARGCGLEVAVRSGGHCFAGGSSTRGLLMDVGPMNGVSLAGEIATVGAGARLGEIYDALARDGRTIAGGCGPTVGIAGLALGGGLRILGRTHGLTSDQLVAAEVDPWGTGGAYANFPDADLGPWDPAYHGANLDRLLEVKARYDPEDIFGAPHG